MKRSIADDITERVRRRYPQVQQSVAAYLAPTGTPIDSGVIDRRIARMTPQDVAALAQTDPIAAERAAERMGVIDARAAVNAPDYSDIVD